MFFLNGPGNELINSEFVERFRIVEKPDAVLIIASYNPDRPAVTLAKYASLSEAKDALEDLCVSIESCDCGYQMKASSLFSVPVKRDARVKRKGGS